MLEPSTRHALVGSQSATLVGIHQVWKTQVSRDKRYRQIFPEGCGCFGLPRAMVAYRLSTVGGVRCSSQVFAHRCSVAPAQHLQSLEEVTHFHAARDAQRDNFGRLP